MAERKRLQQIGSQLRIDAVRAARAAGSGHPTSSMSAADVMAVLAAHHLRYDFDAPDNPGNDHLIFSKGHASPLLYALYKACGAITDEELLTFRTAGSRLEGHPTPRLPWVDAATGSLGQGLPIGVGVALAGKRFDRLPYHVWVLCGDSELAEGSIWEAFEHAADLGLDNLTAIVDVNRLGQRGPTRHGWDLSAYRRRIEAFGWAVFEVDGHDVDLVDKALGEARATDGRPTAILARTVKGSGVKAVEDRVEAHGKPVPDPDQAIAELGGLEDIRVEVASPTANDGSYRFEVRPSQLPAYDVGDEVATREAYGAALAALGYARGDVIALDGEVADSTKTAEFAEAHPDRFVECYIAEQEMLGTAVGLQARGWTPYVATFAAFLTRGYDFVRMAAISGAHLRIVGSHAGVAIGPDGPSQMGLEDLGMFRAVHGSTVLHPCDANCTTRLIAEMANLSGISYLRSLRAKTPVIYSADESFPIGGSKVLRSTADDVVTIVAAGTTVHQAVDAAEQLAGEGIQARVIDAYSIKPIDADTLRAAARDTGRVVTVEDHWPQGGLGEAVLEAFADGSPPPRLTKLAVASMPASASPEEQLRAAGIDAQGIADAARDAGRRDVIGLRMHAKLSR